jgi:hypothetical protein
LLELAVERNDLLVESFDPLRCGAQREFRRLERRAEITTGGTKSCTDGDFPRSVLRPES